MEALQVLWFVLIGVLLAGYAALDGFDLGAGFWHLLFKKEDEKQAVLKSIGPFWDGNEVWLLTGGGALFAAFPPVYATVFSGFYLALMLILFALIFRAVGLEFRNKIDDEKWKGTWDKAFAIGSLLAALLLGVGLGNIVRGVPLTDAGEYGGSFFTLLNPYALVFGLTALSLMITHAGFYLIYKTTGETQAKLKKWITPAWSVSLVLTGIVLLWSVAGVSRGHIAVTTLVAVFVIVALFLARKALLMGKETCAVFTTGLTIILGIVFVAVSIFPNMVPTLGPGPALTIYNASSSFYTLRAMAILAGIGMPIVLGYTVFIYKVFAGKATA